MFVTGKDCAMPKKDNLAKHEISADLWRSTLLPKRQMDFTTASVTANYHVKSAIITYMQTVLTQAKHCLPTVKNAFIRGSLQDLDGEEAVDTWGDTCMTFSVLEICSGQCVIDFLVLYL